MAAVLRCPACPGSEFRMAAADLVCTCCERRYRPRHGVLDLAGTGNAAGDRPYEGFWATVYGWVMDRPGRQRLDAWLLGLDVRRYYREVIARLEGCGAGPHLELPCGNLPFLELTEAYRAGGPWIFADLSSAMLGKLARKLDADGADGQVLLRADACSLPVRDGRLRTIVSLFGLHCFHDKAAVFAELRRCLHPEGKLVLSTLTADGSALSRGYHRLNQLDGTFAPAATAAEIVASARRHGFEIEDEFRQGSVFLCTASPRAPEHGKENTA